MGQHAAGPEDKSGAGRKLPACTLPWSEPSLRHAQRSRACLMQQGLCLQQVQPLAVKEVFWLNIRADTHVEHSVRQDMVPEQDARGAHRLKPWHAEEQR